ncbi:MAG: GAF domain-containing sensor histidine kinase [Anaerolineales bacterium]|nr:GAF domain-containing sensor histidine kinase [Anaerolineales bacterium]
MSTQAIELQQTEESLEKYADLHSDIVALHRATLSIVSDLSLEGVLQRILQAAKELTNAKYGALGIPSDSGGLETFLTLGLSEEDVKQIEHRPVGEGLIGEMLRTGKSIRIPDILEDSRSVGFPAGHPEMHSFLGVPIAAYGHRLGHIYLTDKIDAPAFSLEDQRFIEMLASHAASAIENAKLYQKISDSETKLSKRNEELGLMYSLATAVGLPRDLDRLLEDMLERVMSLFEAEAGEIFLLDESEGIYRKAIHLGEAPEAFWEVDSFRLGEGLIGWVAQRGEAQWTDNSDSKINFLRRSVLERGFQTIVAVPLNAPGKVPGVLSFALKRRRAIGEREVGLLRAIGAGVGIAVENARLYRQARRLAVLEERERIGMDLHDGIIQSIYAVGLTMDYTRLLVQDQVPEAVEKIDRAIEGLNKAIRDLRTYILDLQPSTIATDDIEKALEVLVREFKANTLVDTDLIIEDHIVQRIADKATTELFHIAREALANAAKHAEATRVLVSLREVTPKMVTLQIIDNGLGFEVEAETELLGHGLSNMAQRAKKVGGEFDVDSSPGQGTTITVRFPAGE